MAEEEGPQDLAIIGGGLSGSLVAIQLMDRLLAERRRPLAGPLRLVMFDRRGAFGAGVPYGERNTEPAFLTINPVATSTPPGFLTWLVEHRDELLDPRGRLDDAAMSAWVHANEARFRAGRFDELYVPRRWFGRFVAEQLRGRVVAASAGGRLEALLIRDEVIDVRVRRGLGPPFRLSTADGIMCDAWTTVLAIGSIPRRAAPELGIADGYLHDLWEQGYAGLSTMITDRAAVAGRPLDLVIVGSAASASEVVYFLAHTEALQPRLRSIRIVSRSGYLAGGAVVAPGPRPDRPDAVAEPTAREYAEAARRLVEHGLLSARVAEVERPGVPRRLESGRLELPTPERGTAEAITADVVVNCIGSGRMNDTSSALLRNLVTRGRPLKVNGRQFGFVLRPGSFETRGVDGCFVIGPLLNQVGVENHVESIEAVYEVGLPLAATLHRRLARGRLLAVLTRTRAQTRRRRDSAA